VSRWIYFHCNERLSIFAEFLVDSTHKPRGLNPLLLDLLDSPAISKLKRFKSRFHDNSFESPCKVGFSDIPFQTKGAFLLLPVI
uniref:Uncharacterized protein n=1 Tax=Aegilops tauschii subsp. strangulata TaxID=200361 RepID=A0A452XZW6_AEGTS